MCSQLLSSNTPGLLRRFRHILPTVHDHADGALDAADDAGFHVADDQAAGVDGAVDDIAVDRNDADITISLLILVNNVIHSVINTSRLIISNIKISSISSINTTASSSTSHKRKQDTQLQTQNSTHQEEKSRPFVSFKAPKEIWQPQLSMYT